MAGLGAIRILALPSEASAKRTKLPLPLGGGRLPDVNPHGFMAPVIMWTIDIWRKRRLSLSSPGSNQAFPPSYGAAAPRLIKPAMRVDDR